MSLTEQLTDYVHAAFSGLWVLTQEPDEAEREIAALARWMARLKRAFHETERRQQRIARIERQLTKLKED